MAKILVIEDNFLEQINFKKILEQEGHEVIVSPNGKAGEECYKYQKADLVVVDIFMPVQDGLTTIRNLFKSNDQVKIIAVSCGGTKVSRDNYLSHARDFGAAYSFSKPIEKESFLHSIKQLLEE